MWFEILPSAAIIFVSMNVPWIATYCMHKLTLGNVSKFLYGRKIHSR